MTEPVLYNRVQRPGVLATLRELWSFRELILEFSRRSILLRYKNSLLGIGWSLATPLMLILVITVMTKYILNQHIPNYSAYIFPVMFAWSFFTTSLPDMCTCLLENAPLIRRVYFPRELLPIAVLLANLFHLLIAMVLTLAYLFLYRIFPWQINASALLLLLIIPAQCMTVLGFGFIVSALNVLYEDVRFVVTVLLQVLLYLVPVLYPIERVYQAQRDHDWGSGPLGWLFGHHLVHIYLLNPFAGVLVLIQKSLLPPIQQAGYPAVPFSWGLLAWTWAAGLLILGGGLYVFDRLKWNAVERL